MASATGPTPDGLALTDALAREPYAFDFFQALRRLENLHRDKPRIGASLRPADDPVRLGQEPSMAFAPATLSGFHRQAGGRPPRLLSQFLGLLGPNGPLPLHLTEYARDRLRNADDPTFARFLDLFNHRMLALFYRAWAQTQPTVGFDRPAADPFAAYVGSLFGLGMPALRRRDAMPDLAKLHHAGHLACQTRHAPGLQAILADFFKLPVAIEEFVGHWLLLPRDYRWRLGESPATGTLGLSATVGSRVWDCQCKFRIRLGPVSLADYQRLLPGGDSLVRLIAVVRNYVGDALLWDLNLVLKQEEVPAIRLGESGRLGWTTWLTSRPLARDGDDLFLSKKEPGP